MSSGSTPNALAQEIAAQLPATYAGNYSTLCGAVLLLYDYFLTFRLEQLHIWRGKMNIMKILFFVNRYASLISAYGEILLSFIMEETNTECNAFYYTYEVFSILTGFAMLSIFTLRTYAIYGKSITVFLLLGITGSLLVASGIWGTSAQSVDSLPPEFQIGPLTCNFNESSSSFAGLIVANLRHTILVNITSNAFFDALVVIFTIYRTGRLAIQSRNSESGGSLSIVLLRDGVLYYIAIFIPQLVTVALNAFVIKTGNENVATVSNSIGYMTTSLETVLVNRLVLSLSQAVTGREDTEFRTRSGLEPPTFASGPVLGSIGGPVHTFGDEFEDEYIEGGEVVDVGKAEGNTAGLYDIPEKEESNEVAIPSTSQISGETSV